MSIKDYGSNVKMYKPDGTPINVNNDLVDRNTLASLIDVRLGQGWTLKRPGGDNGGVTSSATLDRPKVPARPVPAPAAEVVAAPVVEEAPVAPVMAGTTAERPKSRK